MEDVPQTLEQLEKNIVARDLTYSFITGEPIDDSIEGTYSKHSIDAKQRASW